MVIPLKIVNNAYELVIPASFIPNYKKHKVIGSDAEADIPMYTFGYDFDFVSRGKPINFIGAPENSVVEKN